MSQHGYIDIPWSEIGRYEKEAATKLGTCRIVPPARFAMTADGPVYSGLVCSPFDMSGEATGVSALGCTNCLQNRKGNK